MLCCWVEDSNSEALKLHLPRLYDYLWIAEDGMKMQSKDDVNAKFQGYNGSQSWDTSFAIQAIISTDLVEEYGPTLRKAHTFMKDSQVLDDFPDHGWPISDCSAEGLKACLLLSKLSVEIVDEPLKANRLYDAVNVMLSLQNPDGGNGTYELSRSYPWLEVFN
uniref:Squalene cyclase C-terminal domain-containing protein n=1 Tax=Solanum lycopersicum TaxID=4081 RepID=K4BS31_SOLLC